MTELPHVWRDTDDNGKPLPHPSIISSTIMRGQDSPWLLPKYLRRGRYVEHCVTMLAQGKKIPDAWWQGGSGEKKEHDYIDHEECRPYVEGGSKFLRENKWKLTTHSVEITHSTYGYQGHMDWLGRFEVDADQLIWIVDLKCGSPNPDMDFAYRMQLALYAMAAGYNPCRRANLYLYDGTYKWVERNDRQDLVRAKAILSYYNILRGEGLL